MTREKSVAPESANSSSSFVRPSITEISMLGKRFLKTGSTSVRKKVSR